MFDIIPFHCLRNPLNQDSPKHFLISNIMTFWKTSPDHNGVETQSHTMWRRGTILDMKIASRWVLILSHLRHCVETCQSLPRNYLKRGSRISGSFLLKAQVGIMCSFSGTFDDPETDAANVNNKFIFDVAHHKGIQQKLTQIEHTL